MAKGGEGRDRRPSRHSGGQKREKWLRGTGGGTRGCGCGQVREEAGVRSGAQSMASLVQKLGSRGDFTKGVEPLEFWL